jgi:haloacetate dehalogenase
MLDRFERRRIATSGAEIAVAVAGSGPPVLLLHGFPQTMAMWHAVAPALAERSTVVLADLRGYGDSSKPASGPDHAGYSKRAMARDMVEVMEALGHRRFAVVGHDRGGRVTHRMALDHPERVERAAVLDIVPTLTLFEATDQRFATVYYHWFFLIQPNGLPEAMIGRDPDDYLLRKIGGWGSAGRSFFAPDAVAEYLRCWRDPATVHAACEDYRAAATIDLVHDRADRNAGRTVSCPLLVLWGAKAPMHALYDVVGSWRDVAADVRGRPVEAGHYLAEEAPEETARELRAFLG